MAKANRSKQPKTPRKPKGDARHPRPYKQGKKPVTIPWKQRANAKLASNDEKGLTPANPDQLMKQVGATKGSINELLDLDRVPQQWTTAYLDDINSALGIEPPLFETEEDDPDFVRDVQLLRSLTAESRAAIRLTMERMNKK